MIDGLFNSQLGSNCYFKESVKIELNVDPKWYTLQNKSMKTKSQQITLNFVVHNNNHIFMVSQCVKL